MRLRDAFTATWDHLRQEPVPTRLRGEIDGVPVVDSVRAVLLWEPRRIVPTYAVPGADLLGPVTPSASPAVDPAGAGLAFPDVSDRPVLDPSVPFAVHTADGESVDVAGRPAAGFRLTGPELAGYVALDFAALDRWRVEEQEVIAHPRDPFHRVDVVPSSRHVRLERDGELLAESRRPVAVVETMLPVRYYLPREDVRAALAPSPTRTACAYKGRAAYWSVEVGGAPVTDIAWSYPEPLPEAVALRDLVAFFDERVDVVVDGERRPRPVTPWS